MCYMLGVLAWIRWANICTMYIKFYFVVSLPTAPLIYIAFRLVQQRKLMPKELTRKTFNPE